MKLDQELLSRLACPTCRGELVLAADGSALQCSACRVAYPIEDDIPALVPEAAVPLLGSAP